jgi:hypothetical protein
MWTISLLIASFINFRLLFSQINKSVNSFNEGVDSHAEQVKSFICRFIARGSEIYFIIKFSLWEFMDALLLPFVFQWTNKLLKTYSGWCFVLFYIIVMKLQKQSFCRGHVCYSFWRNKWGIISLQELVINASTILHFLIVCRSKGIYTLKYERSFNWNLHFIIFERTTMFGKNNIFKLNKIIQFAKWTRKSFSTHSRVSLSQLFCKRKIVSLNVMQSQIQCWRSKFKVAHMFRKFHAKKKW